MIDGVSKDACLLRAENLRFDGTGFRERVTYYELVEYGCDGSDRIELARRPMHSSIQSDGHYIQVDVLNRIISDANTFLIRPGCRCR